MASNIESDGKRVTVTDDAGHRISFGVAELNTSRTSGDITTRWSGVAPVSAERTVRAAKVEAEIYSAQLHTSAPNVARAEQNRDKGAWSILRDIFSL